MSTWTWACVGHWFVLLYMFVGAMLLVRTLIGLVIALRLWRRSQPVHGLSGVVRGNRTTQVRVSPDVASPVTIGSCVLLPGNFEHWDAVKLRIVLAHELSHVRQGDFYLQLAAAVHAAIFWFSPMGWWLQRRLSELGEALSDRAGLEVAPNRSTYAQILLEFAALPRTNMFVNPHAGVAMARTSNLSSRIERILNDHRFRLAFLGGKRQAAVAAVLVPVALVAAIALIRTTPVVEAAPASKSAPLTVAIQGQTTSLASGQSSNQRDDRATTMNGPQSGQSSPPPPPMTPIAPDSPAAPPPPDAVPEAPDPPDAEVPEPPVPPLPMRGAHYSMNTDGDDSYVIVEGNSDNNLVLSGVSSEETEKIRRKHHGNYIWIARKGKSYIISDPAVIARSKALFRGPEGLELAQADLDKKMAELNRKMAKAVPEIVAAKLDSPEFKADMAKLEAELSQFQSVKFKELSEKITEEKLADLEEKIGDIQGHIGDIQGKIGEREAKSGEIQGRIGEEMGRVGEEMGKIGDRQCKLADEASRKMKGILDQAIKDGKAKPVE